MTAHALKPKPSAGYQPSLAMLVRVAVPKTYSITTIYGPPKPIKGKIAVLHPLVRK